VRNRRFARAAIVACAVLSVSSCSWSSSLKAREAVAHFTPETTAAQRAAARAACLDLPRARPEPIATDAVSIRAHTDIRFRVDDANDHDIAQLYACLQKQPGFVTAETIPLSDSNNG
jgi:hypothetical protein